MQKEILDTIEYSKKLIVSPDVDGFMSAKLLWKYNGSSVVGTYDKNLLLLADGIDPKECLFVDCDMNSPDYVSIGNHMRLMEDNISVESFNPNTHYKVKQYNQKFPFATCYLLAFAIEPQTSLSDNLSMAYADSTYKNKVDYEYNMQHWSILMDCPQTQFVMNNDIHNSVEKHMAHMEGKQSFVSRRLGKEKYMTQMNQAINNQGTWKFAFEKLTRGYKYQTGLIDKTTLIRYNKDIMSYAEVYGGEYSVTYRDEVEW